MALRGDSSGIPGTKVGILFYIYNNDGVHFKL